MIFLLTKNQYGQQQSLPLAVRNAAEKLHIAATSNSFNLLANLVRESAGVSFMTWYDIKKQVMNGELAFTPLKDKRLEEELCVCLPSTVRMNEQTQSIINSILKVLQ
ncbi:LysR substrate-binding domain-containing protein [Vibrio natriegens]|uniref:LysR substrate-binding domain-containing protein n=1 Tax=Vibrio natriegens TaxID=691 RepID=UPI0020CD9345|nr:LysR substrate-binding domain-containing protein [Vibrio natriegens]